MRTLEHYHTYIKALKRREGWFLENLHLQKTLNFLLAGIDFIFRRKKVFAWPIVLKIDISPLCNLHCTTCVHARPDGNEILENQEFSPDQRMTIEQYSRIINEIKDKTSVVSLYYLGDPYMHPNLDEMCRISRDAGIQVHLNSNFSFKFSDKRIENIANSGVTHLTVCIDGLSQKKYELTRVGGQIDIVLSNLRRLCEYKRNHSLVYPKIEVQYIKYQHNLGELNEAQKLFKSWGVDQVFHFWGNLTNYVDFEPGKFKVFGYKKGLFPLCYYPYILMVIKYNGDVIPCCEYRIGAQYNKAADSRVLGNVFKTSVLDVWNSQSYQKIRQIVINSKLVEKDITLKNSFCFECSRLFQSNARKLRKKANKYRFEELFSIDEDGKPFRKYN